MKQTNEVQINSKSNSKINFCVILLSVVITILIIGFSIYFILNITFQKKFSQYNSIIQGLNNQFNQNKQIQTDLNMQIIELQNQIKIISNTKKEEKNWFTYQNEKYNFSLKFPKTWENYTVEESVSPNNSCSLYSIVFGLSKYKFLFGIEIYTKKQWQKIQSSEEHLLFGEYLDENSQYIFSYSVSHDIDPLLLERTKEIKSIVNSFNIIN